MALKVSEIFYSIQGESSWSGQPCVFVRLTGCNLRCSYCDTRYAYEEGRFLLIPAILEMVRQFGCGLVEVTGGEPLLQEETPSLVSGLLDAGHTVLLETNGSIDINRVDQRCARIMDVKCPSSGMIEKNDLRNLAKLTALDELKFIIGSRKDYEFAKDILSSFPSAHYKVNFSAVFGALAPRSLAEWILDDRLSVRLNLQFHKIIWGPETRGV